MNTLKILLALAIVAFTVTAGALIRTREDMAEVRKSLAIAEEGAQVGAAFIACLQQGAIGIMDGNGEQWFIECRTGKVSGT